MSNARQFVEFSPDSFFAMATQATGEQRWQILLAAQKFVGPVTLMLAARGVPFYSPTVAVVRHRSDRTKILQQDLFPGYIFVFGTELQRREAGCIKHVLRAIKDQELGCQETLRQTVLAIRELTADHSPRSSNDFRLEIYRQVAAKVGHLEGLAAELFQLRDQS